MEIYLEDGRMIRLDADNVEYSPTFHIYIFYKGPKRVGFFRHDSIEWIAPAEKGENK